MRASQQGGGWTGRHMDRRTDGISPHSKGLPCCPTALLPCCPASQLPNYQKLKQGKGTADHMMPLGDWLHHRSCPIKCARCCHVYGIPHCPCLPDYRSYPTPATYAVVYMALFSLFFTYLLSRSIACFGLFPLTSILAKPGK